MRALNKDIQEQAINSKELHKLFKQEKEFRPTFFLGLIFSVISMIALPMYIISVTIIPLILAIITIVAVVVKKLRKPSKQFCSGL